MAKKDEAATTETEKKASKISRGAKMNAAPAEDAEKKERARKYPGSLKIKVLVKDNPHREGTGRHAAFEAVKAAKTMDDYYASGHKVKYIEKWVEAKLIEV